MEVTKVDDLIKEATPPKEPKEPKRETRGRKFKIKHFRPPMLPMPGPPPVHHPVMEVEDKDFKNSLKDNVFKIGSLPMKDERKREKFYGKLKESTFLNKYVDKRASRIFSEYLNEDGKAACIYSMAYLDTMLEKGDK